jgi:YVTN family beta-propeller protein
MSPGDNDAVAGVRNRIIGMIDLPRGPNRMTWVDDPLGGPAWLYVTSSDEDRVSIVDTEILAVVGDVKVGDAPFDIVYNPDRAEVYVTNFGDDTLTVLDVSDPKAPIDINTIGDAR